MAPESTSHDVIVVRSIDAPPAAVFEFFTSSAKWSAWQGRKTTVEARVGGAYTMVAPNNAIARGTIIEMVPPERIVFTWGWEGHPTVPPGSSTVTIDLTPSRGGTVVTLTHTGLPEGETDLHRSGWDHYMDRLMRVARDEPIGPDRGLGKPI